ncbi:MAG: hypothetical protein Faunusvirus29_10, partial [Faunusvirus sp.]
NDDLNIMEKIDTDRIKLKKIIKDIDTLIYILNDIYNNNSHSKMFYYPIKYTNINNIKDESFIPDPQSHLHKIDVAQSDKSEIDVKKRQEDIYDIIDIKINNNMSPSSEKYSIGSLMIKSDSNKKLKIDPIIPLNNNINSGISMPVIPVVPLIPIDVDVSSVSVIHKNKIEPVKGGMEKNISQYIAKYSDKYK